MAISFTQSQIDSTVVYLMGGGPNGGELTAEQLSKPAERPILVIRRIKQSEIMLKGTTKASEKLPAERSGNRRQPLVVTLRQTLGWTLRRNGSPNTLVRGRLVRKKCVESK
jgi:hypothetical protein